MDAGLMGNLAKCPNNAVKDLELTAAMKKQHLHTAIFLADHRDEERLEYARLTLCFSDEQPAGITGMGHIQGWKVYRV